MKPSTIALLFFCVLSSTSALASPQPWQKLSPVEQEALAPVQPQWDSLPEKQQHELRLMAEHYPKFNPTEKQRFLSRMTTWVKLTPAQRQAARDKYHAFSKVPPEKREQVKQMIKQKQETKAP